MSRDLSGGGLFLASMSTLAIFVACFIPAWWFTTTELRGKMCSCGSGLWTSNFTWGDDIFEENYFGVLSCESSNPLATHRCDADWGKSEEAHRRGHQAGVISLLAITSLSLSTYFGWKHVPGFGDPINAKRACICAVAAFLLQLLAHIWFTYSPLFDDLSNNFGCQFEFVQPLNSNTLRCHALGPGWALSAVGIIFTGVAAILFFFAYSPTEYTNPATGRYSLFTEVFERKLDELPLFMARTEKKPPVDDSTAFQRFIRAYGIPFLCMGNLALFLYSNLSTGATIEPHVRLEFPHWLATIIKALGISLKNGYILEFRDDVFNFTLVSSLRHFWSSRAYALAFLIGAFSGLWPYAKVFGMLMLWFCPATERLRGRALHWIDLLGKWSLIDSFFLCLMCVGFGFDTTVNILGIQVSVNIEVRPGWGVYSFVIATIWSLALSHYLTTVHRRAIERRTWTKEFLKSTYDPPFESLGSRPYAPLVRRRRFKCRTTGRLLVWLLLVIAFCVTIAGQVTKTFTFTFGGLAELILSPEKRTTEYSMVSIGEAIPESAKNGGYLSGKGWNWFLAVQFFLLSMIIPLVRVILLMIIWTVPLTLAVAKRLHHLAEVIAAWSAMDVFLISIIAAVMEIGQLSSEVLSSGFGSIEEEICKILNAVPLPVINAILNAIGLPDLDLSKGCSLFRVDAQLQSGCWVLLAAVLICEIVAHIIMELAEASVAERMAMLSAYHRAKNPLISPRRSSSTREITRGMSAVFAPPSELIASRSVRRLISAQEVGSQNFVGSWFDFFYGPFPRRMWVGLVKIRLMKRVEWPQIGEELHEDLVEQSDTERTPVPSQDQSSAQLESSLSGYHLTAADHLLEQLIRTEEDQETWTTESPLTIQHRN